MQFWLCQLLGHGWLMYIAALYVWAAVHGEHMNANPSKLFLIFRSLVNKTCAACKKHFISGPACRERYSQIPDADCWTDLSLGFSMPQLTTAL